jgi:hypothetical protein
MMSDLTEIKIALARIEERQQASSEKAEHRARNFDMKLDAMSGHVEQCVTKDDLRDALDPIRTRIGAVEKTQRTITKAVIGGAAAVGGGLAVVGKKLGIG